MASLLSYNAHIIHHNYNYKSSWTQVKLYNEIMDHQIIAIRDEIIKRDIIVIYNDNYKSWNQLQLKMIIIICETNCNS